MVLRPGIFEAPERIAERFNFPSFTYARHNRARNLKYRADRRGPGLPHPTEGPRAFPADARVSLWLLASSCLAGRRCHEESA
jgi:hypothetical protein